ncbi:MAG: 30S ribosomal protein S15 [archaeon]
MQKMKENEKPSWLKREYSEVEELIIKLAKQGLSSEKIGMALRDSYGVPKVKLYGVKIGDVLKKAGIGQKPQDLANLEKKGENLGKHINTNKQDKTAKRSLQITKAKIIKTVKYNQK